MSASPNDVLLVLALYACLAAAGYAVSVTSHESRWYQAGPCLLFGFLALYGAEKTLALFKAGLTLSQNPLKPWQPVTVLFFMAWTVIALGRMANRQHCCGPDEHERGSA